MRMYDGRSERPNHILISSLPLFSVSCSHIQRVSGRVFINVKTPNSIQSHKSWIKVLDTINIITTISGAKMDGVGPLMIKTCHCNETILQT